MQLPSRLFKTELPLMGVRSLEERDFAIVEFDGLGY